VAAAGRGRSTVEFGEAELGLAERESPVGAGAVHFTPGDLVFFEPSEDHWHGAAPTRFMTHVAIHQPDEAGSPVTWDRHVSDDEYAQAPPLEERGR
jgi:hypothetical protein